MRFKRNFHNYGSKGGALASIKPKATGLLLLIEEIVPWHRRRAELNNPSKFALKDFPKGWDLIRTLKGRLWIDLKRIGDDSWVIRDGC